MKVDCRFVSVADVTVDDFLRVNAAPFAVHAVQLR